MVPSLPWRLQAAALHAAFKDSGSKEITASVTINVKLPVSVTSNLWKSQSEEYRKLNLFES